VSSVTVWNMIQRGELAARRVPRQHWVKRADVEALAAQMVENDSTPNHYEEDTKRKLRDLAGYHGCAMKDVMRALVQREGQRVLGSTSGMGE